MMNFGLIGCGHWGKNYVRVLTELATSKLVACCDSDMVSMQKLLNSYEDVELSEDYQRILANESIETVVVATPPSSHYSIVRDCLEAGKHVIAEKPLALVEEHCRSLFDIAAKRELQLFVGYTFLFNPAIEKIKDYIRDGIMGDVYYLHSTRTHLGLVRSDINVVWDLAPHDVSIFLYLLEEMPIAVSATGSCFLHEDKEDVAFVSLRFPSGIIGHIHVSWINSNKVREVQVIGNKARAVFDDLNNLEKIRLFEKRMEVTGNNRKFEKYQNNLANTFADFQYVLRDGDIVSPNIELAEPLKVQTQDFISRIERQNAADEHRKMNEAITRVMCCIEQSIKQNGAVIETE